VIEPAPEVGSAGGVEAHNQAKGPQEAEPSLDVSTKRLKEIQSGKKSFAIDRALTFDIDEVLPVGQEGIKPQRAVARAKSAYNRQLLDPNTNRQTKGLGIDPRELPQNRGELEPISLAKDPHALITRRFSEVIELKNVFEDAVASVKEPQKLSPTQLKAAINAATRRIITEGKSSDAVAVRKALEEIGFEWMPKQGWTLTK
jgi:hypothetical protein